MSEFTTNDIIITGIQPWDIEIGSNCKNIAIELSKNHRILYVNNPLDRFSRYKEKHTEKTKKRLDVINAKAPAIEQVMENLWVLTPDVMVESINKIPMKGIFDSLNRYNNKRFAGSIKKAVSDLGFHNYFVFNDQNMFMAWHLKELLEPELYIYYIRDNLIKNPYWRKQGVRLEPRLIKKSDLVVTNSVYYAEYAKKYNENSHMVGQGCDTSLFDESLRTIDVPEDMNDIPTPRIGYVGYLTHRRLDISLLEFLAKKKPEWSIVLVGPEDDMFRDSALHKMKNVYFLGSRKPEELPGYVKSFDVAVNPQILNDATIGNYPRKIDEYLSLGKPSVATDTRAMDYFRDDVYLAENQEDYIRLISKAMEEDNKDLRESRIKTGRSHSWENNVAGIESFIIETLQKK